MDFDLHDTYGIPLQFELLPSIIVFLGLISSHKSLHIILNMLQKTGWSVKQNLEIPFCFHND